MKTNTQILEEMVATCLNALGYGSSIPLFLARLRYTTDETTAKTVNQKLYTLLKHEFKE